jgi:hypothetical protein
VREDLVHRGSDGEITVAYPFSGRPTGHRVRFSDGHEVDAMCAINALGVAPIGTGMSTAVPGSYEGMHLVVTDIEAARAELVDRGVDISEPFHFGAEGQTPGLHPERADYDTYLSFSDPDGNGWLIQEVRKRAPGR